jgi:hypothetical protein
MVLHALFVTCFLHFKSTGEDCKLLNRELNVIFFQSPVKWVAGLFPGGKVARPYPDRFTLVNSGSKERKKNWFYTSNTL